MLGIGRFWPEVFDEMVELLAQGAPEEEAFGGEAGRDARIADLQRRLTRR